MSEAKETNLIENETGKAVSLSLDKYKVKSGGETYSLLDVATQCEDIDRRKQKLEADAEDFGRITVLIAKKCGSAEVFRSLCSIVEERKHWGRPHKDMPEQVKKLYHGAPDTYKVYKSYILTAMESGLMPGQEFSMINGKGESEQVTLDTPQLLTKAKLQNKGTPKASKPQPTGVSIDSNGKQHIIAPRVNVGKGTAPEVAEVLSRVADLFMQVPEANRAKHLRALQALVKRMESELPEHMEAAQEAIAS